MTHDRGIRINDAPATAADVCNIGRALDAEDGGYPAPRKSILDRLTDFEPTPDRDRWWAERWLKSATPAERAAMKELLS